MFKSLQENLESDRKKTDNNLGLYCHKATRKLKAFNIFTQQRIIIPILICFICINVKFYLFHPPPNRFRHSEDILPSGYN